MSVNNVDINKWSLIKKKLISNELKLFLSLDDGDIEKIIENLSNTYANNIIEYKKSIYTETISFLKSIASDSGGDLPNATILEKLENFIYLTTLQIKLIKKDEENYQLNQEKKNDQLIDMERVKNDMGYWLRLCRNGGNGSFCVRKVLKDAKRMADIDMRLNDDNNYKKMLSMLRIYRFRQQRLWKVIPSLSSRKDSLVNTVLNATIYQLEKEIMILHEKLKSIYCNNNIVTFEHFDDPVNIYRDILRIYKLQIRYAISICSQIVVFQEDTPENRSSKAQKMLDELSRDFIAVNDQEQLLYNGLKGGDDEGGLFTAFLTELIIDELHQSLSSSSQLQNLRREARRKRNEDLKQYVQGFANIDNILLIDFDARYRTGIAFLDDENEKLVKIINEIQVCNLSSKEMAMEQFHISISELIRYIQTIFPLEEKLFMATNFENRSSHILEHKEFKFEIRKLYNHIKDGDNMGFFHLIKYLKEWLDSHIFLKDKEFAYFYREKTKN